MSLFRVLSMLDSTRFLKILKNTPRLRHAPHSSANILQWIIKWKQIILIVDWLLNIAVYSWPWSLNYQFESSSSPSHAWGQLQQSIIHKLQIRAQEEHLPLLVINFTAQKKLSLIKTTLCSNEELTVYSGCTLLFSLARTPFCQHKSQNCPCTITSTLKQKY